MSQKYIGVVLPVRLGQSGMFDQSTSIIQQVRSNLKNLILTKKGERVGQPELGCDIWKILFDPISEDTLDLARDSVISAVDRWLPFIEITDFEISSTETQNMVSIKCRYRFRSNPNVQDEIEVFTNSLNADFLTFLESNTMVTPRRVVSRNR